MIQGAKGLDILGRIHVTPRCTDDPVWVHNHWQEIKGRGTSG